MKIKSLLLALLFVFATTAFAETRTIISENFDSLDSARTTAVKASDLPALIDAIANCYAETQDYSKVAYPSRGLRFSNTSNYGSLTTKDFACEPNMPIKIAFKLASYVDEYKGVFEVTVGGQKFTPVPTTVAPNYTDYEIYLENGINASSFDIVMVVPSGTKSGYKSCVVIDDLIITQEILDPDADPVQLGAPRDLVVANLTHESASASWTAVENATKYSVVLVAGETETTFETTETTFAFENLEAETAYTVKVAAVGNGTTYLTSDDSTVSFTTVAAPAGEWKVLFYEEFADTDNVSSETGSTSLKTDNAPWVDWSLETPIYKAYASGGSVRLSLKADPGYAITTNLSFQTLSTRITASVKGYPTADAVAENLVVTIGETPFVIPLTGLTTTEYTTFTLETSVAAGSKPVKISVSGGDDLRTLIDSFKIEQFVLSTLGVLPAPTSVEAVAQTPYSVKVDWSAVTGAASYTITLQMVDEEGNPVGTSIPKSAGYTETSIVVDGLADGVSYNVSVVAVGDGAASLDSVAATTTVATPADTYKPVFTITDAAGKAMDAFEAPKDDPIVIMASAMVGEEAVTVTANNLPEGATFVDGVLTWTPSLEMEANTVFTVDFVVINEGGTYTQSVTIKVVEANTLVVGAITASDITATAATLSWDALPKASSYVYDIWYGSSVITNGVEIESFFDFEGVRLGVIPYDVTIDGADGKYADNVKALPFEHNIIQFSEGNGYIVTKQYPKAVTHLDVYFAKNGTDNNTITEPRLVIYGSSDNGQSWVQIEAYTAADLSKTEIRTYDFDSSLNYTRFKFEYQKLDINVGISAISATYAGAGAKMFAQDQTTTDTSISLPKGLRANTEYYVRIKPVNETRECAYKYVRFVTGKADPATYIIVR